jgi:3-phosphoshikimate 1-carboxyvinyltransferase
LEEMERMGCRLSRPTSNTLRCTGKLRSGVYTISGSVSSQFITGLLFAASLLSEESRVKIIGPLESKPYVDMTLQAMSMFGVQVKDYIIPGKQIFRSPGSITVEGDWSNAAFFLAAAALGSHVDILGLNFDSSQGDKAVLHLLSSLSQNITVSAKDIPDLVPILSVVAACNQGAVFTDIARLRLKESDRVASVIAMLEALGGKATATEHTLTVYPASLTGGTVDSAKDHRIAMSLAVSALRCEGEVVIEGAECVEKSYPTFFEDLESITMR